MLDRVTGMQVFAKVAALGSFSAAARALGMSPAMATKHVDAIEDRLGARLFHRTTRKLTLTDAGARYREACERILAEIEEAEARPRPPTSPSRAEPSGSTDRSPSASGEIAPALADFAGLYPRVTIDLGLTDRFVDLVEEGWDLARPHRQLRDSTPDRPTARANPCRPLRLARLSRARTGRRGRSPTSPATTASATRCRPRPAPTAGCFGPDGADRRSRCPARSAPTTATRSGPRPLAGMGLIYQPTFLVAEDLRAGRLVRSSRPAALPLRQRLCGLRADAPCPGEGRAVHRLPRRALGGRAALGRRPAAGVLSLPDRRGSLRLSSARR